MTSWGACEARTTCQARLPYRVPQLLLLSYLLPALFWVCDSSAEQECRHRLIDPGIALLLGLPLMRMPILRAPLRYFFDMVSGLHA